jgi:hypothetical protein
MEKELMMIIEFVNGKQKKFDEDRFRLSVNEEGDGYRVVSRITKETVLTIPDKSNVLYIHEHIVKKNRYRKDDVEVAEPEDVDSYEEAAAEY